MVSRRNRTLLSLAVFIGVLTWNVAAAAVKGETGTPVGDLSLHEIEEQLQVCQASVVYSSTPVSF
jgi:zinc transporter 7